MLKYLRYIWIATIIVFLVIYLYNPSLFSKESLASYIARHQNYGVLIYLVMHLLRGFVLLPSTPLIFAGVLLFPSNLFMVLIVSLVGIVCSSLLIYFFSDRLGFSKIFAKSPQKIKVIKEKLTSKYGFFILLVGLFYLWFLQI